MICARNARFQAKRLGFGGLVLLLMALSFLLVAPDRAMADGETVGPPGCAAVSRLQCYPASLAFSTLSPSLQGETLVDTKTCSCCKGSTCVCLDEDVCADQGDECQGACKTVKKPKPK